MLRAALVLLIGCGSAPRRVEMRDHDVAKDHDRDGDRIDNEADRCPDAAETYNGYADDDGCPDPIAIDYPSFTDNLFIPVPIFFAPNDTALPEDDQLQAFARWLQSEPAVEVLGVIGHADANEPATLAEARAKAVADALVKAGFPASRLEAHGATKPAHEWSQVSRPDGADRSVHFRYFRLAGKAIYRFDGSTDVRVEQ